jgi:alpha-L-fucosidase 2
MLKRQSQTGVAEVALLGILAACLGTACGSSEGTDSALAGSGSLEGDSGPGANTASTGAVPMSGSSATASASGSTSGTGDIDATAADGPMASSGSIGVPEQPPGEGEAGAPVGCSLDIEAGALQQVDTGIAPPPNLATQYVGTFSSPPTQTDTQETTDAPLLGNGDLGVAVLGNVDAMTFILGKNEFWSLSQGSVKAMARLSLSIPGMAGASYAMTERIGTGQVAGTFAVGGNTLTTTSWVQATDTTDNQLFTLIAYTGVAPLPVAVSLAPGKQNSNPSNTGSSGDVLYEDVQADSVDTVGGYTTPKVRIATRVIGTTGAVTNGALNFALSPGQMVVLAAGVMSNFDSPMYQAQVLSNVSSITSSDVDSLSAAHQAWWDSFYRTSFVQMPDKTIEKEYYASLYLLASASRTSEAPPGLWGPWVLTDPAWNSDYTLNYNYEVPFYAAFPTNHVELADSYDKPVLDWIPHAQAEATSNGWTGAYYRVHIGPLPNGSADTSEHNQKFCGAYAATDMIMHYYYTLDPTYANAIYPMLKQLAIFWENYLVKDGNQYDIVNDAQQEDDPDPQTNGIMSLGLVRFLLQACIDISTALNLDAIERTVWQDRLTNLSSFPTFTMGGVTVFRYTSVGRDWDDGNTIGIQHIYPGSQIGLSSDTTLLQIANNMIGQMARWSDGNGTNTFYPAAARVGYSATTILSQLDSWIQDNTYPNLYIHTGGGGVENFNTVPSTVTEMMLQSFQGTLRVFANWPSDTDAKFGNLRAYGAFLVSSAVESNVVRYVRIVSENGGPFTLWNPWSSQSMVVYRNGLNVGILSGTSVTIQSCAKDSIFVAPEGTSYASIVALANAQ